MHDQAFALLAFARSTQPLGAETTSLPSDDLIVMPRATVTKIHAQIDEHYQRVARSRELRNAMQSLQEALD